MLLYLSLSFVFQAVLEDLNRQKSAVTKAQELAKNPTAHGVEDPEDGRCCGVHIRVAILQNETFCGRQLLGKNAIFLI